MIFAFLPTTLLFFVAMFFFGAAVALLLMNSLAGTLLGLSAMIASLAAEMIAIKGSHALYVASMSQLPLGFDKWYKRQQGIAARSFGMKRMYVISNIVSGCAAYERTEEALEALETLRVKAEKSSSPLLQYIYYSGVLAVREKMHDLSSADYLLSRMYDALNSPKFPAGNFRASYVSGFEYSRAQIEFYKRTPQQLTEDKSFVRQLITTAEINAAAGNPTSQRVAYRTLSSYYNIGLCYEILGEHDKATQYFDRIAASGCLYPLTDRVKRYLLSNDISILFSTMP